MTKMFYIYVHFENTGYRNPAPLCSPSFYLGKDSWKTQVEEESFPTEYPENVNSSKSPVMIYAFSTVGSLLASISSLTKSPLKCFLIC